MHSAESSNDTDSTSGKPSESELAVWIKKAASGNRDYQRRVYELIASRVYRVIRKIVGPSNADDVMQDFVLQLFAKLDQFRFESSLETWTHRMAVNQSLQYLRKASREDQRVRKVALTTDMTNQTKESFQAKMLRFSRSRWRRYPASNERFCT